MNDKHDWEEGDATWDLLGKAVPKEASGRFADDTLRAVRLLPEADPWWPKILTFSPWVAVAACAVFGVFVLIDGSEPVGGGGDVVSVPSGQEERWVQIEEVAEAEMLAAAADHLDRFSDQELVSLIGF
ncbi:hypothetical protein HZ994_03775 [Akkermansiaceae bacterium]|nr:hypothetical protein HZ994_03775 [Akkermansiaceae bacterium]